jgi:hypothetical protein
MYLLITVPPPPKLIRIFVHILPEPLDIVAIAQAALSLKKFLVACPAIIIQNFIFIVCTKSFSS